MPEGHTLFRLASELTSTFAGHRVAVSSPQGRFAADAAVLDGSVLVGAESAGKHLFVEFDHDRFVHVHLGLIGQFDVAPGSRRCPAARGPGPAAAREPCVRTPTSAAPSSVTWSDGHDGTR